VIAPVGALRLAWKNVVGADGIVDRGIPLVYPLIRCCQYGVVGEWPLQRRPWAVNDARGRKDVGGGRGLAPLGGWVLIQYERGVDGRGGVGSSQRCTIEIDRSVLRVPCGVVEAVGVVVRIEVLQLRSLVDKLDFR
jgi:hypothetical protein